MSVEPPRRDLRPVALVNRFPPVAWLYDPLWRGRSVALLTRGGYDVAREADAAVRWTSPPDGGSWLDVGCGSGFALRAVHARRPDLRLVGIDASPAFARTARSRLRAAGVPAEIALGTAEALPYRDATFDAVGCVGTPNELRDPELALREIARVLRPGGRLFLMAIDAADGTVGRLLRAPARAAGLRFPEAETWTAWAEAAGLRFVRGERRAPLRWATFERRSDDAA